MQYTLILMAQNICIYRYIYQKAYKKVSNL